MTMAIMRYIYNIQWYGVVVQSGWLLQRGAGETPAMYNNKK